MMRSVLIAVASAGLLLLCGCAASEGTTMDDGSWMKEFLARHRERIPALPGSDAEHRMQILVSEVIEEDGRVRLRRHGHRLGDEYFYPASSIKLLAAIAALEWQEENEAQGVRRDSALRLHPLFPGEELIEKDPSNLEGGTITLAHEIRKLLLVSDNPAFNRLYDLLGQEELNARLAAAGLSSARLIHRLSRFMSPEEHRRTRRIEVALEGGGTLTLPKRKATRVLDSSAWSGLEVGRAHFASGERIDRPMDFRFKNSISLVELQNALILALRPDIELGVRGFRLSDDARAFLADATSRAPGDSRNPRYDRARYPDDYVKPLRPGLEKLVPVDRLRIHNKTGRAYGFSIENAWVRDLESGRSFFVTAVIYTNPNGTLNDDRYAYDELADPWFAGLGEALARELLRPAE